MKRKTKKPDARRDLFRAIKTAEDVEAYVKNMFLLTGTIIVNIENKTELKKLIKEIK